MVKLVDNHDPRSLTCRNVVLINEAMSASVVVQITWPAALILPNTCIDLGAVTQVFRLWMDLPNIELYGY
jgi:hypothetical protein